MGGAQRQNESRGGGWVGGWCVCVRAQRAGFGTGAPGMPPFCLHRQDRLRPAPNGSIHGGVALTHAVGGGPVGAGRWSCTHLAHTWHTPGT